jgi:hypothetical protein
MHRGAIDAEVLGVDDHLHVSIGRRELLQDPDGPVGRGVVDEDVLVPVPAEGAEDLPDALVDLADVPLLVEAGGHDADESLRRRGRRRRGSDEVHRGSLLPRHAEGVGGSLEGRKIP